MHTYIRTYVHTYVHICTYISMYVEGFVLYSVHTYILYTEIILLGSKYICTYIRIYDPKAFFYRERFS